MFFAICRIILDNQVMQKDTWQLLLAFCLRRAARHNTTYFNLAVSRYEHRVHIILEPDTRHTYVEYCRFLIVKLNAEQCLWTMNKWCVLQNFLPCIPLSLRERTATKSNLQGHSLVIKEATPCSSSTQWMMIIASHNLTQKQLIIKLLNNLY